MRQQKLLTLLSLVTVVALLLCIPSLVGTTYATAENQITATGAAFSLTRGLDQPVTITDGSNQPFFAYSLWEPGYTNIEYFTLECQGSDRFSFGFSFQLTTDQEHLTALADVIDVFYKVTEGSLGDDRAAVLAEMEYAGTLTQVLQKAVLFQAEGSGSVGFAVALQMRGSAGNDYQGLPLFQGTASPYFNIKVSASADIPQSSTP